MNGKRIKKPLVTVANLQNTIWRRANIIKKPEKVCPTRTPIRYKHPRCIKIRPVNCSDGK